MVEGVSAVYIISVAAELAGVHPQTLRVYEKKGLVSPSRTGGGSRRYSDDDIAVLRKIHDLASEGMNLSGIKKVLELEAEVARLQNQIEQLSMSLGSSTSIVPRKSTITFYTE